MDSEIHPGLQPFQVLIEPRTVRYFRYLRHFYVRNKRLIHWTLGAILINSACAAYQSVESYRVIYPGSRIAATILRTRPIERIWIAFYWLLAVVAAYYNLTLVSEYIQTIRGWMPWTPWLNRDAGRVWTLLGVILQFLSWVVLFDLVFCPFWAAFQVRTIWRISAWPRACDGWDIDAVITGVRWETLNQSAPLAATAVINMGGGSYTMQLNRNQSNHKLYNLILTTSLNITPPLTFISYDIGNHTYTANNFVGSYTTQPVTFSALGLVVRDPFIPFVNPNDDCYPPSLDLVHSIGSLESNVLKTMMLKQDNCTALKVCGMRDDKGWFENGLGIVMIEQFRASVYCSTPQNGTEHPQL